MFKPICRGRHKRLVSTDLEMVACNMAIITRARLGVLVTFATFVGLGENISRINSTVLEVVWFDWLSIFANRCPVAGAITLTATAS